MKFFATIALIMCSTAEAIKITQKVKEETTTDPATQETNQDLFKIVDKDGSGEISLDEFRVFMHKSINEYC